MPSEHPPDLNQLMRELLAAHNETLAAHNGMLAAHKETGYHLVRLMERHNELEKRHIDVEGLTKQVAENNIRLSRIIEAHDYDIEELDARLRRIEERRR